MHLQLRRILIFTVKLMSVLLVFLHLV